MTLMDSTKTPKAPTEQGGEEAPGFDAERYLPLIDEMEITEEQKREFLGTLWNIMVAFVDLGFGVDSVQRLFPELFDEAVNLSGGSVELESTQQKKKALQKESKDE